jgi:hypothetical protein|tara:strand:+ start:346 stop:990 length:645 start_codon:yes stop_codon:yes gene_type:complete
MTIIERTADLKEPTLDEIKETKVDFMDEEYKLFIDLDSRDHLPFGIMGKEVPKSIKNMSEGWSTLYRKGIEFGCSSPPQKISASLKGQMSLVTSYAAWEAAGPLGLVAKYAILATKDVIKSKKEESDKPSVHELLSFYIPIINIISVEQVNISKGGLGLTQLNAMKVFTKDSDDKENIFWLTTPHRNPSEVIFKLRFEEEKRLGVSKNELAKFD